MWFSSLCNLAQPFVGRLPLFLEPILGVIPKASLAGLVLAKLSCGMTTTTILRPVFASCDWYGSLLLAHYHILWWRVWPSLFRHCFTSRDMESTWIVSQSYTHTNSVILKWNFYIISFYEPLTSSKVLNGFYSNLPTCCIKNTQRPLLFQIAGIFLRTVRCRLYNKISGGSMG